MKPGEILSSRFYIDEILSMRGTRQRCIAERLDDRTRVVIESRHESLEENSDSQKALQYEIDLSHKLSGPYFIDLLDSFSENGIVYIVWEYVDAQPLTRNDSLAHLSSYEVLLFVSRIVKAITIAHEYGVIHGALSTDAILITPQLEPVIIGFALPGVEPITDPGMQGGISAYRAAAPELFQGEAIDASCDFYSIGIIARFLLDNIEDFTSSARNYTLTGPSSAVQFSRAKDLVKGLVSEYRDLRIDYAQCIIDPTFLDSMATPPHGNEMIDGSRQMHITPKQANSQTLPPDMATVRRKLVAVFAVMTVVVTTVYKIFSYLR